MKKMFIYFCLTFCLGFLEVQADVILHSTPYIVYTPGKIRHSIFLLENKETKKPIFSLQYGENYVGLVETLENDLVFNDEELEKVKKYLTVLIGNKTYEEIPTKNLVAIQALIWNVWANKMNEELEYNFDTAILSEMENLVTNYIPEKRKVLEMTSEIGEEISSYVWNDFQDGFIINNTYSEVEMIQDNNKVTLISEKEGFYEFYLSVSDYQEKVVFWQENDVQMIEMQQKGQEEPKILFQVTEKPLEKHSVYIQTMSGIEVQVNDKEYKVGDPVSFEIELASDYSLEEIIVIDENNQQIAVENNQFVMPDRNVYMYFVTKKINNYLVHFNLDNDLSYQVSTLSGKLDVIQNSFVMPYQDVFVEITNTKQCPDIKTEETKDPTSEEEKEEVFIEEEIYEIPNTYMEKRAFSVWTALFVVILFFIQKRLKRKQDVK